MKVDVFRKVETSESITGEFWLDGIKECYYLEPSRQTPFHPGRPCIEAGTYPVALTMSPHLGYLCPEVLNVPGRTAIRWHIGNFPKDVLGCCVVGTAVGTNQVEDSRSAFDALMAKLQGQNILAEYHDPISIAASAATPETLFAVESARQEAPMPDQTPAPPPKPPAPQAATPAAPKGPTINIGEEYGTAKKNLPPAKIVLIAIGAVLVLVLIASFLKRPTPQASGSLDNVVAVDIPDQNSTMVALTFTLYNTSDKILYVHTLESTLKGPDGDFSADAVSAVDFDRYFQAFPALKNGAKPALPPETKIHPGETVIRTIIVAFPITLDEFNKRKSLSVLIWPYDQTVPVVLTK
jgi:Steigviridae/Suoliviridae L,D-carboxypeptidase/transpeptidase